MNRIKEIRSRQQISQMNLAVRSGVQPGLLCRYEKGIQPSQRNALRIAAALVCDAAEVFPDFEQLRQY